jgi:hypothetical protein
LAANVVRVNTDRLRLLNLIVAHNAESPLTQPALDRLPAAVLSDSDGAVPVIDDTSDDRPFKRAQDHRDSHAEIPLTLLRNQSNQGYGGNQKVRYTCASQEGVDIVPLVHGHRHAPEELPHLLALLVEGTADAVFGSRRLLRGASGHEGTPRYKLVCNQMLIITRPNMALVVPRFRQLFGQFNSGKTGILDRTHTRLFSFRTLRPMTHDSGLQIREVKRFPAPTPKAIGHSSLSRALPWLNQALVRIGPCILSYHVLDSGTGSPEVCYVLAPNPSRGKAAA